MQNPMNTNSYDVIFELIAAIISQPESKRARANLYKQIKSATLYVAAHYLPIGVVHGSESEPNTTSKLTKVPLYTAEGADGSKALLAYLDTNTLKEQCKDAFIVELSGLDVLNLVLLQEHFAALVVKTSAGWAGIPRADVRLLVKGYAP
jgi:hypothetical protein